jgi:hypothetical protein
VADNTSGNSEELKLRITPELNDAALKKVQDQLDDIKGTVQLGGKTSGKGTGAADEEKKVLATLKEQLRQQDLLVKQADIRLRKVRANAEREIASIRERGAAEKLSLSEINNLVSIQEDKIQRATQNATEQYRKVGMELDRLKVSYDGIVRAETAIVNSQGKLFYANERLQSGFNSMSGSMQGITSQTKNANLAFMNFGRIVQDAPFGLIGISNNIDPLLVSFRHLSQEIDINTGRVRGAMGAFKAMGAQLLGPAGLIFLLGSALPTALLFLQKRQREQASATKDSTNEAVEFTAKVLEMKSKVELATIGFIDQDRVVKEFNETLAKSAGVAKDINDVNDKLNQSTPDIIKSMVLRAQAQILLNDAAREYVAITTGEEQEKSWSERLDFEKRVNAIVAKRIDLSNILNFSQIKEIDSQARIQVEKEIALEKEEKLLSTQGKITELLIQSANLTKDINTEDDKKSKYFDKSIVDQTKLNILAEKQFSISSDQTKSWEERLAAIEKGVFYQRTSLDLQLKSLQDQRSQTKDAAEQLKLDSEILKKKDEIAKTDQIIVDFQKQMSDARVDQLTTSAQMLQALEEEAKKYEEILPDEIDTGEKIFQERLKDAAEFINTVSDLEIEKAIYTGDKLKALYLERKQYEDRLTQHYISLHYDREVARQMAENESAAVFAHKEAATKLEIETEKIQAIGELATASLGLIFGQSKDAQIAQVVIDTIMGIQKIWSQAGLNAVVGALGTATLAAKGMAAINKIRSTEIGTQSVGSSGSTTMGQMGNRGLTSAYGQGNRSMASQISQSAQPAQAVITPLVNIDAQIDRKGLALAVRDGEQDIRTQQFSFV